MPVLQKVRVRKMSQGIYQVVGRGGLRMKLLPKDTLLHQHDPIGVEFDVMVQSVNPSVRLIRKKR